MQEAPEGLSTDTTHPACFLLGITQQAGEEDASSPLVSPSWAEYTISPQMLTAIKLIASPWVAAAGALISQPRAEGLGPCALWGIQAPCV